jgi:hypothetical protein
VTGAEYTVIVKRCQRMWRTVLRGRLPADAFDDFVQTVAMALVSGTEDAEFGNLCRSTLRDMRRDSERQAEARAQYAFEGQRPGRTLPAAFAVPFDGRGGARKGAGRPRKVAA